MKPKRAKKTATKTLWLVFDDRSGGALIIDASSWWNARVVAARKLSREAGEIAPWSSRLLCCRL